MRAADLAYWINAREDMRRRKELGDNNYVYGYSDDPHMGTVRYCNVHRENDKVTRWMRQNWTTKDSPVWWFVLGRMLNYIPTLEDITLNLKDGHQTYPSLDVVSTLLKKARSDGYKVFTSAYTISTCGQRMDKIDYVVGVYAAVKDREDKKLLGAKETSMGDPLKLEHTWGSLTRVKGLGSFLAAQVVADLKNTPGHPLQTAPDRATWCAPGPGSLRGLQAFWGRPVTPRTFVKDIQECYAATMPLVGKHVAFIDMQDFQNCLCEFSKYDRVSRGVGHARNKYTPG